MRKIISFVFLLLAAWLLGLCAVNAHEQGLTMSDVQKSSCLSETRGEEANPMDSLYGEWWLVGWNDNGTWYEVNKKYVCHRHLSLEINEEGYMTVYSMVNIITFGQVTLDGNEMHFDVEKVMTTQVCCDAWENNFFEKHLIYIKSYQLDGNLLRLYYTDNDYFVFTKDFDDSEEQNDYIPFIEKGKKWHVFTTPYLEGGFEKFMTFEEVEHNGKTYVHVYRMGEMLDYARDEGMFREENRRVYKYDEIEGRELLMYDFSLKEGDTFTYELISGLPQTCKVLKQGWLDDGPYMISPYHYRKLRTWTIGRDNGLGEYHEIATWIEGVGTLENMFCPFSTGMCSHLFFVERQDDETAYFENTYLPFSCYNIYGYFGQIHGCDLPTGKEDFWEDGHHQLTYELEGNRLHIHGKVLTQCGPNNYAYFYEKPTDDPLVHKIEFSIQEVEPTMDCMALHETDFYVSGFDPNLNYIVVDDYGEEHPVINKTPKMSYRPFVEDNKVWQVGDNSGNPVRRVEYYYFEGDTIINGKTCKQMMCQRYVAPDHPDYAIISQLPPLSYVGAWYEEDQKVYFCNAANNQFKLMYDFSLNANDTLWVNNDYPPYIVGPRQTGGINGFKGVYRGVMMCGEGVNTYNTTWLEGVGGIDGPMVNLYYGKEGNAIILMACVVDDEVLYFNDEYEDGATPADIAGARKNRFDFTHTIKEKPKARTWNEEDQSLYGEYNERQLSIDLNPIDEAYMVSITDQSGKTVYEKPINAGSIVGLNIDISKYPEGNYTVTVENSNESFTGEFKAQLTGIEEVRSKKIEAKGYIYNLQGQRLSRLQKGLNIVNGQKIYIK
jgi:hypothetical protein